VDGPDCTRRHKRVSSTSFTCCSIAAPIPTPARSKHDISLWFSTGRIDELDQLLKSRQLAAAAGGTTDGIEFEEHINDTFYPARQLAIRDLNGYVLYFIQDLK
jgi:hypothetical protein